MTSHSIYRIVCTANGKVYIGQSYHPKKRKGEHFNLLKRGLHPNIHLQNAFTKYDENRFYFEVIEKGISPEDIDEREVYWIAYFDSYKHGYNRSEGGDKPNAPTTQTTWNGVTYPSLKEASEANGIARQVLSRLIKRGFTCDDDIPKTNHTNLPRACIWNGVSYPSIRMAAEAIGVSQASMQMRIANGYTSDDDMKGTQRPCVWNGIEYPSLIAAAKALDIQWDTLQKRFERGQICDADMKGAGSNKLKPCSWNGIEYPSIRSAAETIGIREDAMSRRLKKGYDCDNDLKSNRAKRIS